MREDAMLSGFYRAGARCFPQKTNRERNDGAADRLLTKGTTVALARAACGAVGYPSNARKNGCVHMQLVSCHSCVISRLPQRKR